MKDNRVLILTGVFWFLLIMLIAGVWPAAAAGVSTVVAGVSSEEALRLGETMYLRGMLPSGEPMKATAQGDTVVKGTMTTCSHCHMKSGLGSYEGRVLTLPTNGTKLYSPLEKSDDLPGSGMNRGLLEHTRRAYTDEALAKALRDGVDPEGRVLSETMPRYMLTDKEMEIMIFYLKNLSSEFSPGMTDDELRFATIVTGDVSADDRSAMLDPLKTYVREEWNPELPMLETIRRDKDYRTLSLEVWELKGAPDTWREQLEAKYRQHPVFGILGGISSGKWNPVHEFCEKNKVPCILPVTDLPVISEIDLHTLYFSKGLYQEGETAAKYLARVLDLPRDKEVVQVFRDNDRGSALSRGFEDVWKTLGKATLKKRALSAGETVDADFWKTLSSAHPDAVLLLWLGPEDVAETGRLANLSEKPSMIFVSWSMLGARPEAVPDEIRDFTFMTYPNSLPEELGSMYSIVEEWLKARKMPRTNLAISSRVYTITRLLSDVLINMRGNVYRDYFLDLFDTLEDQRSSISLYPRLTFGPGQRYASKGCYVVTITRGDKPKIIRQSDWIVY